MKASSGAEYNETEHAFRRGRIVRSCMVLCLLAASALAGVAPASGAEAPADGLIASPEPGWPQWRGPRRDGISDEKGLLPRWPEGGPRLLWKVNGLGRGWSSPIVVGGRLYIAGDVDDKVVLFALDTDGSPLWQATNGKAWQGSFPGSRACCVFSEGRLHHLNAHGRLASFDAASGKELWSFNILDRFQGKNITWALSECLLVDGPRLIVTPGGKKGLVAALDKRSGATLWTTEPLADDRTSHSSPILFRHAGRRLIANCSGSRGFGIDADGGTLLWTVPLENRYKTNVSTPVYGQGSVFYVTPYSEEGRLYRLRPNAEGMTAEHVWHASLDTVTGGAVLVDGTLFAARYRKPKWWFATDWQTGETKSELEEFSTGAAIHADGRLYLLDETGTVGLVKPGPGAMETVGRFRLLPDRVRDAWAHPVLFDGRLYLRYHDALYCYGVR
ncbi:MAG: PQQ-binding-like beta-propeller repeat protein [Planctomycetes bacterium]|nr:PQQ-binding-like beta-propeller repeat protein [Planctomycetota bacterium]